MSKVATIFKFILGLTPDPLPLDQKLTTSEESVCEPEPVKVDPSPRTVYYTTDWGKIYKKRLFFKQLEETICKKKYDPSKKDLILDLDNTLICASCEQPQKKNHLKITVEKWDKTQTYYVIPRPGLQRALKKLSRAYNISVFTAGAGLYARRIIQGIGIGEFLWRIYDRDSCNRTQEGKLVKNVWDFEFNREKTIFVDDSYFHIGNHEENGLLIKPFYGEKMDRELLKVADFLDGHARASDVRPVTKHFEKYETQSRQTFQEEMLLFQQEDEIIENNFNDTVSVELDQEMKYESCREIQSI